jgi:Methyltransferase domain
MFGCITETDKRTLQTAIETTCDTLNSDTLKFCEIGIFTGDTARGIKQVTENKGKRLVYWGVDNESNIPVPLPFFEANVVLGDSAIIYPQVPDLQFDILFIDGSHCTDYAMLDFLNFSPKVKLGGIVLFHDTSPKTQHKLDYQGFGPSDPNDKTKALYHEFGTGVRTAFEKLGLIPAYRSDWELVSETWSDENWGGISIFRKLK